MKQAADPLHSIERRPWSEASNRQPATIPRHVAIIMDGNRRWAKERGLPSLAGHKKVADDILEPLIEHASEKGVECITFWAWSTENWQRKRHEVTGIMKIFRGIVADRWERLHEKGVRVRVIGDISKFDDDIRTALKQVIEQTKNNTKITAVFALNYGGRDEILRAINKAIRDKKQATRDKSDTNSNVSRLTYHVSREELEEHLDTAGILDPEMIVRTGGERRLSGFLLWQSEYSELFFPEWHMPEFTPKRLDELLKDYVSRSRRFGK